MRIPSGQPGPKFYAGWPHSPHTFHCAPQLPSEFFLGGQTVYFPSEVFVHRSLIIVLEPGNSDVAHVCFAHQKKEVLGGHGKATTISYEEMAQDNCKFTLEIYILNNILYMWLSTLISTIQRRRHEMGDSLWYCDHINRAVHSHFKYQCSPLPLPTRMISWYYINIVKATVPCYSNSLNFNMIYGSVNRGGWKPCTEASMWASYLKEQLCACVCVCVTEENIPRKERYKCNIDFLFHSKKRKIKNESKHGIPMILS